MAEQSEFSNENDQLSVSPERAVWLAVCVLAAAALPHFFLEPPIDFYLDGNFNGWLGLTVWTPTFLAAVALFVGVDPRWRPEEPLIGNLDLRLGAGAVVPVLVIVALAAINFDGYQRIGEWGTLGLAMVVYAGIFSVGVFFWQGLLQHVVLRRWPAMVRAAAVAAAGAALWLPFLAGDIALGELEPMWEYAIVYLGLALLYELGLSVLACTGVGLLLGVGYAWVHQMVFY